MSKQVGWGARRDAASTIIAESILYRRAKISAGVVGALLLVAQPAFADTGRRAMRIGCSPEKDSVVVEPFIIWNDDYHHNQVNLVVLRSRQTASIGDDNYTIARSAYPPPIHRTCRTATRTVSISIAKARLLITETTPGKVRYVRAELRDGIGAAWDVSGPTYRLQSEKPGAWQACTGREGMLPAQMMCAPKAPRMEPPRATDTQEDWAK